jgi:fructose-1-phosphate kinase PfkB-like protein
MWDRPRGAGAAEIAILARGAEGSVLTTATERWFAPAADVPVVSVTGAGDSFVAGATLALSRGMPLSGRAVLGRLRGQCGGDDRSNGVVRSGAFRR